MERKKGESGEREKSQQKLMSAKRELCASEEGAPDGVMARASLSGPFTGGELPKEGGSLL